MLRDIFFSGWQPILHTLIVALIAYPAMLVMVRVSGHRTLSKMNAFDLVVTVALGSTLASAITSKGVSLAQGLLAFFMLIGLQYLMAGIARRSRRLESLVNGEPVLLFHKGRFLESAMHAARLTQAELLAAMRTTGVSDESLVESVVLETNGEISVSKRASGERAQARSERSTLRSVPGAAAPYALDPR